MELEEFIKRIDEVEKNVDKVLKAARLERHERQPMDYERYKFTLYFVAGMVAMVMGFAAAYMVIYFAGR
jgi:hypothetical protein